MVNVSRDSIVNYLAKLQDNKTSFNGNKIYRSEKKPKKMNKRTLKKKKKPFRTCDMPFLKFFFFTCLLTV